MSQEYVEEWNRYQSGIQRANDLNRIFVFGVLAEAGITEVAVAFDGEGDDGQITEILVKAKGKTIELPCLTVALHRAGLGAENVLYTAPLNEAVEALCYGYLQQEHGGWENNGGAFGEFIFNVPENEDRREQAARDRWARARRNCEEACAETGTLANEIDGITGMASLSS